MAKQVTAIESILQNYADECRRIMDDEREVLLDRVRHLEEMVHTMEPIVKVLYQAHMERASGRVTY